MSLLLINIGLLLLITFNVLQNRALVMRLLAVGGGTLVITGLIIENADAALFDRTELIVFGAALLLIAAGVYFVLRGRRRNLPVTRSRGLVDVAVALLLLVASVGLPAFFASQELPEQLAELPTATPGPTQDINDRARGIFDQVAALIAEETGLDTRSVAQNLDEGVTVSAMVQENGGDLEVIVAGISEILTEQVQILAAQGDLNSAQAGLLLSQMELIVRLGVNQDLAGSLARFESNPLEEDATAEATQAADSD